MLLRSRIILPVSRPPIPDGGLFISGNRIVAVGSWRELKAKLSGPVTDLGESILMPGLINAHCHLDYTNMAGQIAAPKQFPDWIKAMLALKAHWSYSEYAQSWLCGANMLLKTGTTTVADIEAVPELLPDAWSGTPLRVRSFLEITGVKSGREPQDILADALARIETNATPRHPIGLSPHALYSTKPELLRLTAHAARQRNLRVTTHVAESREEFEMYRYRRGPLFEWLKSQRDMSDCEGASPVQQLAQSGLLSKTFLAVHVNHLATGDAELLSRSGSSVVHCPRSHAYFRHDPFPHAELIDAGVNVCLGTDSSASMSHAAKAPAALNMFAEMQEFHRKHSGTAPASVLKMATMNGAKALGLEGTVGELAPEAYADIIALPYNGNFAQAEQAAVDFQGAVSAVMIDGNWASVPA